MYIKVIRGWPMIELGVFSDVDRSGDQLELRIIVRKLHLPPEMGPPLPKVERSDCCCVQPRPSIESA